MVASNLKAVALVALAALALQTSVALAAHVEPQAINIEEGVIR